jgi:hypothetical protein
MEKLTWIDLTPGPKLTEKPYIISNFSPVCNGIIYQIYAFSSCFYVITVHFVAKTPA